MKQFSFKFEIYLNGNSKRKIFLIKLLVLKKEVKKVHATVKHNGILVVFHNNCIK